MGRGEKAGDGDPREMKDCLLAWWVGESMKLREKPGRGLNRKEEPMTGAEPEVVVGATQLGTGTVKE